jgi:two-component system sensor histidine kinase BarA
MAETSSVIKITNYPGLDWDKTLELATGSKEFAEELLALFIKTLPDDMAVLQKAFELSDYSGVKGQAHKIHGALCYCSFPDLKQHMLELEKACLEENIPQINTVYLATQKDIDHLLAFVAD